jgi:hypothetical protein
VAGPVTNAALYSFAGSAMKPFRMRRASVMTLRIAGSMDSLLKLMKQPQFGHWLCCPSRTREILSRKRALHLEHVTASLSVFMR